MTDNYVFPRGFVWGAASAAYQIEGACNEDGKGASIWDTFSHTPGKIKTGETGDVACDHYHRFSEDLQLARQMNIKAYRFSLAWSRIFPQGKGAVNERGLDFYDRLVDNMLAQRIEPYITLYHWDLPQALQDQGGWANRDTAGYFADYAAAVARRLGDRVTKWITINEPWVATVQGHVKGNHAPGLTDLKTGLTVGHHMLLGHGMAVQAVRSIESEADVGIALSLSPPVPETEDPADLDEAEKIWQINNAWFLDPIFSGCYPPIMYELFGEAAVPAKPNDFAIISQKIDFLGVNYYFRNIRNAKGRVLKMPGSDYTDMGWEVHPESLRTLLVKMHNEYRLPPVFITENGCALQDQLSPEGHVHDTKRIKYIHDHLVELRNAMREGVAVKGYFVWSLTDNFEWAFGTSKRFGLIYVDFPTLNRYIKDSGYWYAKVVQRNEVHK
jgi:beta-glucosidase